MYRISTISTNILEWGLKVRKVITGYDLDYFLKCSYECNINNKKIKEKRYSIAHCSSPKTLLGITSWLLKTYLQICCKCITEQLLFANPRKSVLRSFPFHSSDALMTSLMSNPKLLLSFRFCWSAFSIWRLLSSLIEIVSPIVVVDS